MAASSSRMAGLHHHHHHVHHPGHQQQQHQQQQLVDVGGAVHLPVQPAPPGMAAMTQEQHSAAEFTHLCTTFSDCIEALPPTVTRSISDLRELDAVLSGSLGTITAKLNELLGMLENGEVKPEQRFGLLKEIAEEARSFRLGGEDKIRVATGTCETLIHHTNQLDVLAHLLATLLPTSMAGTVAPPSWPHGYPVLFPTQASASGSAYRKPDYLPSSTHLPSITAAPSLNYPPGRHTALHQNHASAFGHVPSSLGGGGGGNTAGGASHSLSSAQGGHYISARHAQLQDTAVEAVHRYVKEGASYPDQAYIHEQVQKQLNERPSYPSTSSGLGQKRQRQTGHAGPAGNGNGGKSRNHGAAGSNGTKAAAVPASSTAGSSSATGLNGGTANGNGNGLHAASPLATGAPSAVAPAAATTSTDLSSLFVNGGTLDVGQLPLSSAAMSATGSTSSQFPGGLVRNDSATGSLSNNGRREDDPNFIPYANKSHAHHTKTSLDAVSENGGGLIGGIGVPEALSTAATAAAGAPYHHQHRDSSSSAGTGVGLTGSAKKRRASTKDNDHIYGIGIGGDDGDYAAPTGPGTLSPIVTTAGAAMGRERQNSGRASNGGAQSPVVPSMVTGKRSRTSSKRGVDSPDPASPYLNNGNGRTPSSATFPASTSAAAGASQRRKTSLAIYDEPEPLVPALEYGADPDEDLPDPDLDGGELEAEGEGDDTRTYCYCDRVSYGDMIGCDGEECVREWFHLACVGLENPPRGEWYCDECAIKLGKGNGVKRRRT